MLPATWAVYHLFDWLEESGTSGALQEHVKEYDMLEGAQLKRRDGKAVIVYG